MFLNFMLKKIVNFVLKSKSLFCCYCCKSQMSQYHSSLSFKKESQMPSLTSQKVSNKFDKNYNYFFSVKL